MFHVRVTYEATPPAEADHAYVLGLLHDIGRREGVTDLRHVLGGYTFMTRFGAGSRARGA